MFIYIHIYDTMPKPRVKKGPSLPYATALCDSPMRQPYVTANATAYAPGGRWVTLGHNGR